MPCFGPRFSLFGYSLQGCTVEDFPGLHSLKILGALLANVGVGEGKKGQSMLFLLRSCPQDVWFCLPCFHSKSLSRCIPVLLVAGHVSCGQDLWGSEPAQELHSNPKSSSPSSLP